MSIVRPAAASLILHCQSFVLPIIKRYSSIAKVGSLLLDRLRSNSSAELGVSERQRKYFQRNLEKEVKESKVGVGSNQHRERKPCSPRQTYENCILLLGRSGVDIGIALTGLVNFAFTI